MDTRSCGWYKPSMEHDGESERDSRATFLAVALAVMFGIPCIGFLVVITEGFILAGLAGIVILGAVASVHYFLWGRSMSQKTAGEREEEELREKLEAEEWDLPETR